MAPQPRNAAGKFVSTASDAGPVSRDESDTPLEEEQEETPRQSSSTDERVMAKITRLQHSHTQVEEDLRLRNYEMQQTLEALQQRIQELETRGTSPVVGTIEIDDPDRKTHPPLDRPEIRYAYDPTYANWRPRGKDPAKKLIKDKEMYNPWRYEIDAKFEIDGPLFPSERSKVNYALTQMDNPVFDAMQGWVMDMGGSVSFTDLMDELEHYLGVHLQLKEAKRELLSIKQQPTEPVTEYHQRLQRLWHRARTNEDERIEKFKVTMLPSLSSSLLARNYTRVRDLLDDARQIEDLKKDILHYHPRDRPRRSATQGFGANRDPTLSTSRIAPPAPASTRFTAARHPPRNAALTPTSKKPNGWVGPWYDPVANPKSMDDAEKDRMIRQGRCWSCRGSGHRSADDCCPMHSLREKRLHALSTGDLIELDSSEDENAGKA